MRDAPIRPSGPARARTPRRRRTRGAGLGAAALAVLLMACGGGSGGGAASSSAGGSASGSANASAPLPRPGYTAAADYFGEGDAYNLWSSGLGNAKQAFAQMKRDGFNAVGLVVPWGGFQTGVTPPRYNHEAFARLNTLVGDAKQLGMGVVLRLSYFWDVNPADQMPIADRFDAVWANPQVYASWLDYIGKLHHDLAGFGNVWQAYLSWEDLWQPVGEAQAATTPAEQLALARSSGYQSWLQSHSGTSLAQVSAAYGTQFSSFSQVPTPSWTRPTFRLMYQYQDWALIHHLFLPAAKRFPGLNLEARVDVDPVKTGTRVVGSFTHTAQLRVPGTSVTGIYYTPYMGDPSSTHTETAAQSITAMRHTFSKLSALSAGKRLFLYEYQFGRNSVEIAGNPQIIPSQIPTYLAQSVPLLEKYTSGYALWTYRDYTLSSLFNPSFTLGGQGWKLTGGAHATAGKGQLQLSGGAGASQAVPLPPGAGTSSTVSFTATAPATTSVQVRIGTAFSRTVRVAAGTHQYKVTLQAPTDASRLTLRASGTVSVTNVQFYTTTLLGNVYSVTGSPEVGAAALRAANHRLTSAG